MVLHGARRAIREVEPSPVRLPPGGPCGEVRVHVGYPPVVLFLEFVSRGFRSRIATLPKCDDKIVALPVSSKLLEISALLVGDNPVHVLSQPFCIDCRNLALECNMVRS